MTRTSTTTTPATAFGPLFGDANADAILQSSDEVDFFVYRDMLSTSSPIFKTMFTLPQPTDVSETEKKRPTIKLTEDSKTIAALLTYIYRDPLGSVATELQKCAMISLTTPERAGDPVDCASLHCEVHARLTIFGPRP